MDYNDICRKTGAGQFCKDSENAKHDTLTGCLYDDNLTLSELVVYKCRSVRKFKVRASGLCQMPLADFSVHGKQSGNL